MFKSVKKFLKKSDDKKHADKETANKKSAAKKLAKEAAASAKKFSNKKSAEKATDSKKTTLKKAVQKKFNEAKAFFKKSPDKKPVKNTPNYEEILFRKLIEIYDKKDIPNIWIERIRSTWKCEGSKEKELSEQDKITDGNLKKMLSPRAPQIKEFIGEEVVKTYLIKLQSLYLCDNPKKSVTDYKNALENAGLQKNILSFLDKCDPEKDKNFFVRKLQRKIFAKSITTLLNNELIREMEDYLKTKEPIFELISICCEESKKQKTQKIKEEYNKLKTEDQPKVESVLSRIEMSLVDSPKYKKYKPSVELFRSLMY